MSDNIFTLATRIISGAKFSQKLGESIFESGEKSIIRQEYSCRRVRSSNFKCRVPSEKIHLSVELGLTQKEKTHGLVLNYLRAAVSELLQVPFDEVVEVSRASIIFEEMVK